METLPVWGALRAYMCESEKRLKYTTATFHSRLLNWDMCAQKMAVCFFGDAFD